MIVLFFADVVGKPGRDLLAAKLPGLSRHYGADAVIANGENATDGKGISPAHAELLLAAGVDVITTGNHVYKQRDIYRYLDEQPRVIRPFNYLPSNPGRGVTVVDTPAGRLGVVNLSGHLYLNPARSPFEVVGEALEELEGLRNIIVDFHAEATSEKVAMGYYLDGRVSVVVGTHTHIPTADTRILPNGTAYVSDVGMVGALHSVLGMAVEPVIERFLTQLPNRFDPVDKGPAVFNAVIMQIDEHSGKAVGIQRLDREVS